MLTCIRGMMKQSMVLGTYVVGFWSLSTVGYGQPLGLQTGGVGEGYVFSAAFGQEWQSQLGFEQKHGTRSFANTPGEKLTSQLQRTHVLNAYSYRSGPHFYIVGFGNVERQKVRQSMREGPWTLSRGSSVYTLGSHVVLDRNKMIFAATIGLRFRGEETKKLKALGTEIQSARSRLITPHHAIGLGWKFSQITVLSHLKFSEKGTRTFTGSSSGVTTSQGGESAVITGSDLIDEPYYELPWEVGLHGLMDFASEFQLAASFLYIAAPAIVDDYQWSHVIDSPGQQALSGNNIQRDFWKIAGGMRYFAQSDLSVALSVEYRSAQYSALQYASLELDNLGGLDAYFDVEFGFQQRWRWSVGTSYQYPLRLTHNYKYDEGEVLKHQRIPIEAPSSSTISQVKYGLMFSLAYIPQAIMASEDE